MPKDKEKQTEFVVTDRRKFNLDGEARPDAATETEEKKVEEKKAEAPAPPPPAPRENVVSMPPPPPVNPAQVPLPTAEEQAQQVASYSERTKSIDERLEKELNARGGGRKLQDYEMTFEKFVASIYMTALMQLGLVHEQGGEPRADLIGARQTIDTLALLAQKTKGNLTPEEDNILQNCLYELRMAFIELTSTIARPPQGGMPVDPSKGFK